jgi:hypothetical protein
MKTMTKVYLVTYRERYESDIVHGVTATFKSAKKLAYEVALGGGLYQAPYIPLDSPIPQWDKAAKCWIIDEYSCVSVIAHPLLP